MGMDWVREDTVTSLVVGGECLLHGENSLLTLFDVTMCPKRI